jgi:hypothetical protein
MADEHHDEQECPIAQQIGDSGCNVVSILLANLMPQNLLIYVRVELLVSIDRARNLEAGRAQEPDILAHGAIDRDHGLGAQQTIGARLAVGRKMNVVAQVVALADLRLNELEGRIRHLDIDH